MIERAVTIQNKLGLHARAAAKFVSLASGFQSSIELSRSSRTVNGKSIMGVMMLAAGRGTSLVLRIDGRDEGDAATALEELINARFGEAE
jgi:phosphocarrier protein HPr